MKKPTPTFIILGVAKAGTTSLHDYLSQHPEVYLTPIKETNYFAQDGLQIADFRPSFQAASSIDIDAYFKSGMKEQIHLANVFAKENYYRLYEKAKGEKALGEICTSYFFVTESIKKINQELPKSKVAVFLRNPIERTFSGYVMALRLGQIMDKDFLRVVQADYKAEKKGFGISFNFLDGSLYAPGLKEMYTHFPEERRKVFLYDDYKKEPQKVLQELFEFLEVDPSFQADFTKKSNQAGMPKFKWLNYIAYQLGFIRQAARRYLPQAVKDKILRSMFTTDGIPKLTEKEREWLADFFRKDVEETSQILGKDLSHWLTK